MSNYLSNQKRPLKLITLKMLFVSFKLFCCFCIALANFSFVELLTHHLIQTVEFKNQTIYDYYQNHLYFMEFICWFLYLITFFIWSKSNLIQININQALAICAVFTLFITFGSLSCSFIFFIFLRHIHCCLLSFTYWINFLDLLTFYPSKHLIPISLYFASTCLAAIFSKLAYYFSLPLFYLIISFAFTTLALVNKRSQINSIQKIRSDEDFALLEVTFRGIRTSLAFFELISMIAILLLNISPFLSSIDLMNYNVKKFDLFKNKFTHDVLFERNSARAHFKTQPKFIVKPEIGVYNLKMNYCTIGLIMGFLFTSIVPLIKLKKIYLSHLAKILLATFICDLLFGLSVIGENQNYMNIFLFFALAINFCIRINDIIQGFKRFLILSEVPEIRIDFLYLKSISLLIVSIFFGFVFGVITLFISIAIADTDDLDNLLFKQIAQSIYIAIMIRCSFESTEFDHFLIYKKRPKDEEPKVKTQADESQQNSNNQQANNSKLDSRLHNSADRSDRFSSNAKSTYNPDRYNNDRQSYFTNDPSHGLTGTDLTSASPSAPSMFDSNANSNVLFGSAAASVGFGARNGNEFNSNSGRQSGVRGSRRQGANRAQNTNSYTQPQQQQQQQQQATSTIAETKITDEWEN